MFRRETEEERSDVWLNWQGHVVQADLDVAFIWDPLSEKAGAPPPPFLI